MKKIFVNEEWCLGCHLCEYYCTFANSGLTDMAKALKNKKLRSGIHLEACGDVTYAVSCRHCPDPICVRGCLTGALSVKDGVVCIDRDKCIGCYTCVGLCPYGAVVPDGEKAVQKCAHCMEKGEIPLCVQNCPNRAIVYTEEAER
ncbi:MAG: 4Fe-4S dicluster domain-containing protein [Clostridia bacterium]